MIRVLRSAEPADLRNQRRHRLACALIAHYAGTPIDTEAGYDVAREPLYRAQGEKCCYCERGTDLAAQPVEHFRPRAGWWWLAWQWENLLFACHSCNTGYKGVTFPLDTTTKVPEPLRPAPLAATGNVLDDAVPASCLQTGIEAPLLVDPGCEDPLDHVRWTPVDPSLPDPEKTWYAAHLTPRGEETIKLFKFNLWLKGEVTRHIQTRIWPRVRELRGAPAHQRASTWNDLLMETFLEGIPHQNASYCALDYFVPHSTRLAWGLTLARPWPTGPTPCSTNDPDPAVFAPFSADLRLRILADHPSTDDLIVEIGRLQSWTYQEIAGVFGWTPAHAANRCRALVDAGRLQRSAPGTSPVQVWT